VDEVGQPGVAQPGTGDGSRDDATGSRAVSDDLGGSESSPGHSSSSDGDPLGMAWPSTGRASGRASSDWYGQATARNSHDRYPTSGGDRHPSEGSGGHVRRPGERHPSDPHGFAPLRAQPDPSAGPEPLAGPDPSAGPEPLVGPDPSASLEPRPENPSHTTPGVDAEAWGAPGGNRYWSRTSTGPARGSVPLTDALTDALTAETIEAPLLAAAAARPYGEPVSAAIRLPEAFVPRPRAGDSYGQRTGDVPREPNDSGTAQPAPDIDPVADSPRPGASRYPESPYARASAAVPIPSIRPDLPAPPYVAAERRSARDTVSPEAAGSSVSDGGVVTGPAGIPSQPRPAPAPMAATSPMTAPANAPDVAASTDWSIAAQHGSSEHGSSGGAAQRGAPRDPDGPTADRSGEQPRPAAIPMPGRPSRPADVPPSAAVAGSGQTGGPDRTGAGRSEGESRAIAEPDVSEDVPPIFRQTANPRRPDLPNPAGPPSSGDSTGSRPPGEVHGWSPSREARNRRGPWLRGAGSIRSGRFGGRPMSMFSSSPYEDDQRRDPGVSGTEPDAAGPEAGDVSPPTAAMRPATYPATSDAAASQPRRDLPPDLDESWYANDPAPSASGAAPEPPGTAEHDWDDLHRFALVDQPTLPHRVPAKPDVPFAGTDDLDDFDDMMDEVADLPMPDLDSPELSRIASRLRHDEESVPELPDELDVAAVLAAVRQVNGVRSAQLRPNPGGVHILRLDLADDADAGRVSRQVARLLKERMGLAAEPRRTRSTPGAAGYGDTTGAAVERPAFAPPSRPDAPSRSTAPARPTPASEPEAPGAPAAPVPAPRAGSSAANDRGRSAASAGPSASAGTSASAVSSAPAGSRPLSTPVPGDSDDAAVGAVPSGQVTSHPTTKSAAGGSATPARPAATDPGSGHDRPGGPTVAAPGFRPTMPGEPGAFLPGMATVAPAAPLARVPGQAPRIVIDQVHVSTLGTEATVEVRLHFGTVATVGQATGPAVDAYLLRLAAQAAAGAIDSLITAAEIGGRSGGPAGSDVGRPLSGSAGATAARPPGAPMRCYIEHAGVVPFGSSVVAVVVVLVSGDGRVEQLVGSALVAGDPRHSIVRATLAAVNRRLESLLT
jgi:hypothetical protein